MSGLHVRQNISVSIFIGHLLIIDYAILTPGNTSVVAAN